MSNNDNDTIATEGNSIFSFSIFGYKLSLEKITERFETVEQLQDYYSEDTEDTGDTDTTSHPEDLNDQHEDIFSEPEDRTFTEDDRHVGAYLADAENSSGQYDVCPIPNYVAVLDAPSVKTAVVKALKGLDAEHLGKVESPVTVYNHLTGEETEVDVPDHIMDGMTEVAAIEDERVETPDGSDVNQYLGQTAGNGDVNEYLGEADD